MDIREQSSDDEMANDAHSPERQKTAQGVGPGSRGELIE
jgi:hypothetical protein